MLGTWDRLIDHGTYTPSRFQGSPLAELSIGALSEVGGQWLSAAMSIALAVLAVWSLFDLAQRRLGSRYRRRAARRHPHRDAGVPRGRLDEPRLHLRPGVVPRRLERPGAGPRSAARGAHPRDGDTGPIRVRSARRGGAARRAADGEDDGIEPSAPPCTPSSSPSGTCRPTSSASGSFSIFTADRPTGQGIVGLVGRAVVKPTLLFGLVGMALLAVVIVVALVRGRAAGSGTLGERWLLVMIAISVS